MSVDASLAARGEEFLLILVYTRKVALEQHRRLRTFLLPDEYTYIDGG